MNLNSSRVLAASLDLCQAIAAFGLAVFRAMDTKLDRASFSEWRSPSTLDLLMNNNCVATHFYFVGLLYRASI